MLMSKRADFLYGHKDGKDLDKVFQDLKWYDTLLGWREEQWSELITRYVPSQKSLYSNC